MKLTKNREELKIIEKSKSLQVSEEFFKLLNEKLKNKNINGYYQTFNNHREHGLTLNIYDNKNSINIWCCQCRNSDRIMIVIGSDDEKTIVNMFSEKAFENAKYFDCGDYDSAIQYAYNIIKLNFKENMKEVNYRFELHRSMEDLEKINEDLDLVENTCFASYIDESEKLCCDLEVRNNSWCLTFHKIISNDEYEDIIDLEITPNLENDISLMIQMKSILEDFINQELGYQVTCGNPKI